MFSNLFFVKFEISRVRGYELLFVFAYLQSPLLLSLSRKRHSDPVFALTTSFCPLRVVGVFRLERILLYSALRAEPWHLRNNAAVLAGPLFYLIGGAFRMYSAQFTLLPHIAGISILYNGSLCAPHHPREWNVVAACTRYAQRIGN